ncbi:hypothetical protein [Sulfurimonas sp. HSL-1716]|uniref:hypothetical protein n=1 Tax=Hydrocurvibacter sulfurireducens TaxID=3131937 RepID=UPI0031F722AB
MFVINRDFAPPFKLIAPYFIIGVIFYIVSSLFALSFNMSVIGYTDPFVIAWVHLFLLGFVIMIIFGAMAQLVPVVLESGHFAVNLYYVIWPLLLGGTLMMAYGFTISPSFLPFGGMTVLAAMFTFLLDTFLTIKKIQKKLTFTMLSIIIANLFLLLGILFGITLAFGFAGKISIDLLELLKGHVYLVVVGYVMITIFGLSMTLIPMFALSHHFSWRPIKTALLSISLGVLSVAAASLLHLTVLAYIGYLLSAVSLLFYLYQIYILYKTRARKENDIYAKSLYISHASLLSSLPLGLYYLYNGSEAIVLATGWLIFTGFFGFMIIGHLYKIVPFLIWFERFSPLVGKEKVPMLAEMVPQKSANIQIFFGTIGVFGGTCGILFGNNMLFKFAVASLSVGSLFLLRNLIYIMRFK